MCYIAGLYEKTSFWQVKGWGYVTVTSPGTHLWFWNQIFTWVGVSLIIEAKCSRSGADRYFCCRNRRSSSNVCALENNTLRFRFLWPPCVWWSSSLSPLASSWSAPSSFSLSPPLLGGADDVSLRCNSVKGGAPIAADASVILVGSALDLSEMGGLVLSGDILGGWCSGGSRWCCWWCAGWIGGNGPEIQEKIMKLFAPSNVMSCVLMCQWTYKTCSN